LVIEPFPRSDRSPCPYSSALFRYGGVPMATLTLMPSLTQAATIAPARSAVPTVPAHVLPHRTPAELLTIARQGLDEAARTRPDGLRYAAAHLAALRAAAAVLAARARPEPGRRSRLTNVWFLLAGVAPELSEWAAFFAAGASKRAAAE